MKISSFTVGVTCSLGLVAGAALAQADSYIYDYCYQNIHAANFMAARYPQLTVNKALTQSRMTYLSNPVRDFLSKKTRVTFFVKLTAKNALGAEEIHYVRTRHEIPDSDPHCKLVEAGEIRPSLAEDWFND